MKNTQYMHDANGFLNSTSYQEEVIDNYPTSPERYETFSLFAPAATFSFTTPPRPEMQQHHTISSPVKKQLFPTASQSPTRPAPIQKPAQSYVGGPQQQLFAPQHQEAFSPPQSPNKYANYNSHSLPTSPNRPSGPTQYAQYPQALSSPATPQRFHHGSRSLDDAWLLKEHDKHHSHYAYDTPDDKASPWTKADIPVQETKPINLMTMGIPSVLDGKKQHQNNYHPQKSGMAGNSLFNNPVFITPIHEDYFAPRQDTQQLAPNQSIRYSYPPVGVHQHQTPQQYAYNYQQQAIHYQQRKYPAPVQQAPLQAKDWADPYLNPGNYQQQAYGKTVGNTRYQQNPIHQKKQFVTKSLDDNLELKSQKHKDFLKAMKEKEKQGYHKVKAFCEQNLKAIPDLLHWKVCMDLADIAKRENLVSEARYWYSQVNALEPKASQGWLEHAKLEEESGEMDKCDALLRQGLEVPHCKYNESLIIKYIKLQEQKGNLDAARQILARLKNLSVDKSWKIILEGALLESRAGNVDLSRKIFKYLMANVPRHGPIYYEAYRLEEKCEKYENAFQIVQQGLSMNARYGPLWFAAFHLMEKLMKNNDLTEIRQKVEEAVANISKELVWKVYFEAAQIEERAGNLEAAREFYVHSVDNALDNLRWKVWLAGSRTELNAKNVEVARLLLNRALTEVPSKSKAVVLIECARLEEYVGNLNQARAFLKRAQKEAKHEWKVFLESILLEMRAGEHKRAIDEAINALEIHRGTGRLWAVLIQLKHIEGEDEQLKVFKEALEEVPKSGEVWCEGARIRLNPLSPKFNLAKARRYLEFAIKFTPQYGDSLIEYQRLELLQTGPKLEQDENKYIEQLCVNADPNYGPLWVHCKQHPLDSTRQVLRHARELLMKELLQFRHIYQKAILSQSSKSPMPLQMKDAEGGIVQRRDFITGLHSLNALLLCPLTPQAKITDYEDQVRKKFIFGSELSL